jgi:hypothetical protein
MTSLMIKLWIKLEHHCTPHSLQNQVRKVRTRPLVHHCFTSSIDVSSHIYLSIEMGLIQRCVNIVFLMLLLFCRVRGYSQSCFRDLIRGGYITQALSCHCSRKGKQSSVGTAVAEWAVRRISDRAIASLTVRPAEKAADAYYPSP